MNYKTLNTLPESETIVAQTQKWIRDVVVGCNFCPFAARELNAGTIHYEVLFKPDKKRSLEVLVSAFTKLDTEEKTETIFLIFPDNFSGFKEYLQLVELSEALLKKQGYEGIYQIASFHPDYLFAGSEKNDPANYTNRSPYPMLHLLREASVSRAIDSYPNIDEVPQRNINYSREKGLRHMQLLRTLCFSLEQ